MCAAKPKHWPTTRITLLHRLRDSADAASWDKFTELYSPLVYAYCRQRGLQDADAHDVTQSVLSQVSVGIKKFEYEPERGLFRSWLGTVTLRTILNQTRKEQSQLKLEQIFSKEYSNRDLRGVDGEWVDLFNAYIYEQAIKQMRVEFDDDVWHAFHETYIAGRLPSEVATELDRTVGWVYQAKFNVIRRLKEAILFLASDTNLYSG